MDEVIPRKFYLADPKLRRPSVRMLYTPAALVSGVTVMTIIGNDVAPVIQDSRVPCCGASSAFIPGSHHRP